MIGQNQYDGYVNYIKLENVEFGKKKKKKFNSISSFIGHGRKLMLC